MLTKEKWLHPVSEWYRASFASFIAPVIGALPLIGFGWLMMTRMASDILGPVVLFHGELIFIAGKIVALLGWLGAGLIGIPLHFLFRSKRMTGRRLYLIGGAAIASLPVFLFAALFVEFQQGVMRALVKNSWTSPDSPVFWLALVVVIAFAIAGSIAGWVFWWITGARMRQDRPLAVP